jgi:hypothetical protein
MGVHQPSWVGRPRPGRRSRHESAVGPDSEEINLTAWRRPTGAASTRSCRGLPPPDSQTAGSSFFAAFTDPIHSENDADGRRRRPVEKCIVRATGAYTGRDRITEYIMCGFPPLPHPVGCKKKWILPLRLAHLLRFCVHRDRDAGECVRVVKKGECVSLFSDACTCSWTFPLRHKSKVH